MGRDRQPIPLELEPLLAKFREWEPETYPDGDHEWMALQYPEAMLLLAEIDSLRAGADLVDAQRVGPISPQTTGVPDDPDMLSELTEDELPVKLCQKCHKEPVGSCCETGHCKECCSDPTCSEHGPYAGSIEPNELPRF